MKYAILLILALALVPSAIAQPNGKVDICHKPGANNQKIINVSTGSLPGHINHGDYAVEPEVCDGQDSDCDAIADNGADCSDGIDCTVDSCDGLLGCSHSTNDALCNDQNASTADSCTNTGCVFTPIQICGNQILEAPEQCDDGNNEDDDGCTASCIIELPATLVMEDVRLPPVGNWGRLTGSGLMPDADTFICDDENGCRNIGDRTDANGDLLLEEIGGCQQGSFFTGFYAYTTRADGRTITSNAVDQTTCSDTF